MVWKGNTDISRQCCGCAAAGLGSPLQEAVLEERGRKKDLQDYATGMGCLSKRAPVGYGPGTLVLSVASWSKRGKRVEEAVPPRGD